MINKRESMLPGIKTTNEEKNRRNSPFKVDLRKYAKQNQSIVRKNKGKATINNPRHVQQAKSAAMLNPIASIFTGGKAIYDAIRGKA